MASSTFALRQLNRREARLDLGGKLVTLAGIAVLVYGAVFVVQNFTTFIEIGLSKQLVGGDAASVEAFSATLYHYVSHLQVNLGASIVGYGMTLTALGWFGIRRGERWTLCTVLMGYLVGLVIGLPIHYVYGLGTLGHLGPFYVVTAVILIGVGIAYSGLAPRAS